MKEIPVTNLNELREGDLVRGKSTGWGYIVTGNYGYYVIAVHNVSITNPSEWFKLVKENE